MLPQCQRCRAKMFWIHVKTQNVGHCTKWQSLYSFQRRVKTKRFPPSPAGAAAENTSCTLQVDYERYPSMPTVCQLNKPAASDFHSVVEKSEIRYRVQIFAKINMQTVGLYIEKGPLLSHPRLTSNGRTHRWTLCAVKFQGYLGFRGVKEPGVVSLC